MTWKPVTRPSPTSANSIQPGSWLSTALGEQTFEKLLQGLRRAAKASDRELTESCDSPSGQSCGPTISNPSITRSRRSTARGHQAPYRSDTRSTSRFAKAASHSSAFPSTRIRSALSGCRRWRCRLPPKRSQGSPRPFSRTAPLSPPACCRGSRMDSGGRRDRSSAPPAARWRSGS